MVRRDTALEKRHVSMLNRADELSIEETPSMQQEGRAKLEVALLTISCQRQGCAHGGSLTTPRVG
jgi:hypothetical protein